MPQSARLRKVGGSVVVAIPPAMLSDMNLKPDDTVNLDVRDGKLVLEPQRPPKYSLADLLREAREHQSADPNSDWISSGASGRELI